MKPLVKSSHAQATYGAEAHFLNFFDRFLLTARLWAKPESATESEHKSTLCKIKTLQPILRKKHETFSKLS